MNRRQHQKSKAGLPPGTPVFTGEVKVETPDITVTQYNESSCQLPIVIKHEEKEVEHYPQKMTDRTTWYDVRGLSDVSLVEKIGRHFDLHPLAIEDILNPNQRAKWDDYDNGIFLIVRALRYDKEFQDMLPEQVSFFLQKDVLLSFQEDKDDLFAAVRERIQKALGKLRVKGTDYLLYALMDCIVDDYIAILERTEDEIETLEIQILTKFTPSVRSHIYKLKRQLAEIRRAVLPLRDVVSRFVREENELIDLSNRIYIRDLYDHVVRVIENVENQREMLNSLDSLFNAEQSNKATHVMKVLTIVSAIFIPLTFIVGVYGTNFDYLPELKYPSAYFIMWGVMIVIVVLQLIYFRLKKWI
jgi:magnesium transporter